jgi:Ran GTPase-activating protein (RanGAP) involved in mRNA processing and transport
VLLNSCGISGDDFAEILKGLWCCKDVKSVVYKLNGFTDNTVAALSPLLARAVPFHLEELKLINLQIQQSAVSLLITALKQNNNLKVLSLVNLKLSERHFDSLILAIQPELQQLDLSWCGVRPRFFERLFSHLSNNTTITHLSLTYNTIGDNLADFVVFIKNNRSFQLLNLEHCNLQNS